MRSMSKQTLDFKCGWFWPHCNTYFTSLKKHWNVAAFPHFLWRSQLKFLVLRPTDLQIGDTQGQFHRLLKPRATGYRAFMFKPTTMYVRQYKYYIILYIYIVHTGLSENGSPSIHHFMVVFLNSSCHFGVYPHLQTELGTAWWTFRNDHHRRLWHTLPKLANGDSSQTGRSIPSPNMNH